MNLTIVLSCLLLTVILGELFIFLEPYLLICNLRIDKTNCKSFFLFWAVLGFELRASHLLGSPLQQFFSVLDIFETGSYELFAWADWEL
jgi:hypothetical protein